MNASVSARLPWLIALALLLHAALALFFIRHGALNPDEGFYAAASRAVFQGEVPYRDFGYTQPPLLPYINGLALRFAGYGLFSQRALNGLWTALALALAAGWVAKRAGGAAAILFALLFSTLPPWMYFNHLGKTYAFTGLLAVLAAWIWLEWPGGAKKSAMLGLAAVVGVGCRLPAAPFFGLLWLASLWDGFRPGGRQLAAAIVVPLIAAGGLLLPFYLLAPDNARFWVFDFHRISVPLKIWRLAWQEIVTLAPALWAAAALAAGLALARRIAPRRRESLLALAALAALAANLLPSGVYEEYGVPFLLPLGMAAAAALAAAPARRWWMIGLLGVHVLATPLVLWRDFPERRLGSSQWLTPNAPRLNPNLPAQLDHARAIVETLVPPGTPLVGPNLILALETDRPVPPELRMGPFSVSVTVDASQAARLHLATPADIEARLRDPAVPLLAFFPRPQLNYGWSLPTYERIPAEISGRWLEIYRRDFSLVLQEGDFLLLARTTALDKNQP